MITIAGSPRFRRSPLRTQSVVELSRSSSTLSLLTFPSQPSGVHLFLPFLKFVFVGNVEDVVIGFDTLEERIKFGPNRMGVTVGRVGNRIKAFPPLLSSLLDYISPDLYIS